MNTEYHANKRLYEFTEKKRDKNMNREQAGKRGKQAGIKRENEEEESE